MPSRGTATRLFIARHFSTHLRLRLCPRRHRCGRAAAPPRSARTPDWAAAASTAGVTPAELLVSQLLRRARPEASRNADGDSAPLRVLAGPTGLAIAAGHRCPQVGAVRRQQRDRRCARLPADAGGDVAPMRVIGGHGLEHPVLPRLRRPSYPTPVRERLRSRPTALVRVRAGRATMRRRRTARCRPERVCRAPAAGQAVAAGTIGGWRRALSPARRRFSMARSIVGGGAGLVFEGRRIRPRPHRRRILARHASRRHVPQEPQGRFRQPRLPQGAGRFRAHPHPAARGGLRHRAELRRGRRGGGHTCGFIDSAVAESLDAIGEALERTAR